jgi:hypothetical protein
LPIGVLKDARKTKVQGEKDASSQPKVSEMPFLVEQLQS